jgi:hypothetical protein
LTYTTDLKEDGICVLKDIFTESELNLYVENCKKKYYKKTKEQIHNNKILLKKLEEKCGADYLFHDYIFVIEKSSIHTCHHDSNCELFNKINHPSYTFIIY